MFKTVLRRLLILVPQLGILSLLIFIMAQFMPGDALRGLVTPSTSPEALQALRELHGLNDPWYIQYINWISNIILRGDFGMSLTHSRPVSDVIGERIMNTFSLSLVTVIVTYVVAIPLGMLAAKKQGTIIDRGIIFYTFVALSTPTIVFALINILIFAFNLGWFPPMGSVDPSAAAAGGWAYVWSRLHHLLLPGLTAGLLGTVGIIYFLRSEILDYEQSDFVNMARSKGIPSAVIYRKHILRNAFLPVAGGLGTAIAGLLAGSVFIERVFSFPGMGQLFLNAIISRDFPVANTLIVFYAVLTVLSILLSDIIISLVDPRISIE